MASKVNTKFVIILSAALVLVFGGMTGAFVLVKLRSGDRYVKLGDSALARGDIEAADQFYARAVGKDQSRVDWIVKWRDTREKKVPETFTKYQEDFGMYMSILRTLATTKRTDVDAHRAYLELLDQRAVTIGGSRELWEQLAQETQAALRFFEPERPAALHRYLGLSAVAIVSLSAEPKTEDLAKARDLLEAAVKADPVDARCVNDLAVIHRIMAARAKTDDRAEEAQREQKTARDLIAGLVAADPAGPFGQVALLNLDAADINDLNDPRKPLADNMRVRLAAMDALAPRVRDVFERIKTADPKALTYDILARFLGTAIRVDPKNGPEMARAVIDRALEGNKKNADLLGLRSQIAAITGDQERAISEYQEIIDLPLKPISWEGIRQFEMRRQALFLQTNASLGLVVKATTPEARKAALARAMAYRETLAKNVPEASPDLTFIDGKIAQLSGDPRGAERLLTEFVRSPGGMSNELADAYVMLSEIAIQTGKSGTAIEHLERVLPLRPGHLELILTLARLHSQMQHPVQAAAYYQQVLDLNPDHEAAKKELEIVRALGSKEGKVGDPVVQVLVEAERARKGDSERLGDDAASIEVLQRGLSSTNYDARVVLALARMQMSANNLPGAVTTVEAGLAKHPDDESLKDFARRARAATSLQGVLDLIDQTQGISAADRLWARYQACLSFQKSTEAAAALDELAKAAPDDARVVETVFLGALAKRDFAEADRLAEQGTKLDLDRTGGDTFRARVLLARGKLPEAVSLLQRAAESGSANQALTRLLGMAQLESGQYETGLSTLDRALKMNPSDLTTIRTVVGSLARLGRIPDALAAARQAEAFAQRDPEFLNLWLNLEAGSGNVAFAIGRREQLMARDRTSVPNQAALAGLYMDAKDWDRARALIDQIKAGRETDVGIAVLDARWHADRGDLELARQVFVSLIEAVGLKQTPLPPEPHLAFGQFMLARGRADWGLAALRQAERLQDPKTMGVSQMLGDSLLGLGRFEEAEPVVRKVLAAGIPDPQLGLRKRLIECLVQQRKMAEAEQEFVALGAASESDVELMSQRAQVARDMGDPGRSREILDRAIAKFPNEPLPYFRRARLAMLNSTTVADAIADLDTAIKLRPSMWQALRTRAYLRLNQGGVEPALADLRSAVEQNPGMDALRMELLQLLLQMGRENDAVDAADAAMRLRPTDTRLILAIADKFSGAGRWARALRYYKSVWEQLGDAQSATVYVGALLSATPPGLAEAEAALADPRLKVDRSADLLMARAALRRKQGRDDPARIDAIAAFDLCIADARMIDAWLGSLRRTFTEPRAALAVLDTARVPVALNNWRTLQRAVTMLGEPTARAEAISALRTLAGTAGVDKRLRADAIRFLADMAYSERNWEEMLALCRSGLELIPDDSVFNNNAAYVLSEELSRAPEALPFAERAAAASPGNEGILDTLASVHWRVGGKAKAIQVETEALRRARKETDKAKWGIKLAGWKLETGDKGGARGMLDTLRELVSDYPALADEYKTKVDQLEKDIQAAR